MLTLVAESISPNLDDLPGCEDLFGEGERGELHIQISRPVSEDILEGIEQRVLSEGVILTAPIMYDGQNIVVAFEKGFLPLLPLALIIGGSLFGSIIGWQLFKQQIRSVVREMLPFILIGGAAVLYLWLAPKFGKEA